MTEERELHTCGKCGAVLDRPLTRQLDDLFVCDCCWKEAKSDKEKQ